MAEIESLINELTEEELNVMEILHAFKTPLQEPYIHLVAENCRNTDGQNSGDFEPKMWKELDERYNGFGYNAPYSQKIHDAIESLLWNGRIARLHSDGSYLYEPRERQLNLFPYKREKNN